MRPLPPSDDVEGFEWRPHVADTCWQVAPFGLAEGLRCRHSECDKPGVLRLDRARGRPGIGHRWWHYCEAHAYGRWIEGDRVMEWRRFPIDEPSVAP